MKKLFKYPGGKSRELKTIETLIPTHFERIIEPFAGSAALSFHLEQECILNEIDDSIVNFYKVFQNDRKHPSIP